MSASQLKMLELEENVQRKDMTWQEWCLSIDEVHRLKRMEKAVMSEEWGQRQTAALLGLRSNASVMNALIVAEALKKDNVYVATATSMTEALAIIVAQKQEKAIQEQANRLRAKFDENRAKAVTIKSAIKVYSPEADDITKEVLNSDVVVNESRHKPGFIPGSEVDEASRTVTVPLSQCAFNGDSLELMANLAESSVDAILSDPPYAIDMENLEQTNIGMKGIDSVRDEHTVEGNLSLLEKFMPLAFRVLRPNTFMVLFYDVEHHEKLRDWGISAGFQVQRWPLVWAKPYPCQNGAPHTNFTKKTEFAMVFKKGSPTLQSPQTTNVCTEDKDFSGLITLGLKHPFWKPYRMWQWIINATTRPGETVLDPFAGMGSCPDAVIRTGRRPLAFELKPAHYNGLLAVMEQGYKEKLIGTNYTLELI